MFLLTHHNNSDHYDNITEIAVSDSREKLENFIPTYKASRKEFYERLRELNARIRNQIKSQFKTKPFEPAKSFNIFYPYIGKETLEHKLYQNKQPGLDWNYLFNRLSDSYDFPIVFEQREEDEEFNISKIYKI